VFGLRPEGCWECTQLHNAQVLLLLHAPGTACVQQRLLRLLTQQALLAAAASWRGELLLVPLLLLLLLLDLLQHKGREAWLPACGPGSNHRTACGPTTTTTLGPLPVMPRACCRWT
jgi:hypothetical protein